jgi:hypothetical protein
VTFVIRCRWQQELQALGWAQLLLRLGLMLEVVG